MDVKEAFESAKPLGRTQVVILLAAILMHMETGPLTLSNVFLARAIPYHCGNHSGFPIEDSVPQWSVEDGGGYSTCSEYTHPGTGGNETRECRQWEFDTEADGQSIVSEWSLVCGRDFLPTLAQTLVIAGFASGATVGGPVADRYGRRTSIITALILYNLVGLSVSLAPSYAVFVVLRFIMGGIFKSVRIPTMNLLFESLIPKHRAFFGVVPTVGSAVGQMAMAGVAFLVRDWRYFHIVLLTPTILMMPISWILPESVTWLLSQGRHEEAEATIQKVAAFNGVKDFPSPALSTTATDASSKVNSGDEQLVAERSGARVLIGLFKQPTLTVTLVLSLIWITSGMTYFAFALNTGSLAGDPYLNFFIGSCADGVAVAFVTFLLKRYGNMRCLLFGFAMASVMLICTIVLSFSGNTSATSKVFMTIFAFSGRFFVVFTFQPGFLMMSDLFPTPVRNSGTAIVHLIGNLGSVVAPQLLYLNKFVANFSSFVMLVFCVLSTLCSFLLPETVGFKQPQTREDLQRLFDSNRLIKCGGGGLKADDGPGPVELVGHVNRGME